MNLEEYKKNLLDLIEKNSNIINEETRCKIASTVDMMVKNFNGEEKTDKNLIQEITLTLSEILLKAPISDDLSELANKYAEFLFNWNNNIGKEKHFEILSIYMSRISELRNNIIGSIMAIKVINDRYKDLAGWTPPVFEIAKAYFEQLLKKHEGKEGLTDEETRCLEVK